MSDKRAHLTVALTDDMTDEGSSHLVSAISQLRGVSGVMLGEPVKMEDYIARSRFRSELASKFVDMIIREPTEKK